MHRHSGKELLTRITKSTFEAPERKDQYADETTSMRLVLNLILNHWPHFYPLFVPLTTHMPQIRESQKFPLFVVEKVRRRCMFGQRWRRMRPGDAGRAQLYFANTKKIVPTLDQTPTRFYPLHPR